MLQIASIIFHLVRDAVDDHAIVGRFIHSRAAQFHELGGDSVGFSELIHLLDKCRREAVFAAAENSDFHHSVCSFAIRSGRALPRR